MNLDVMRDGSERIRYQDPAVPIYITDGDLKSLSNMAALCHWHEDVELLMPYRGYLSYNVNGQRILVNEGDAVFVNSRQMHYGFTTDGTGCEYHCICFKPELLRGDPCLYDRYVLPLLTNQTIAYLLFEKENPAHAPVLNSIREIAENSRRDMALLGRLHTLWQEICNLAEAGGPSFAGDRDLDILKRMLGCIHAQYSQRITLEQIALAGGVSVSKCCQIFRKYMGHSPNDYVTSYRLEKAAELLRTTDRMVTEIAFSCGFNSASYFAEVFAGKKGCTPKAYRKTCGQEGGTVCTGNAQQKFRRCTRSR